MTGGRSLMRMRRAGSVVEARKPSVTNPSTEMPATNSTRLASSVRNTFILAPGGRHWRLKKTYCDADCKRSEEHTSELQSLMRISYAVFCLKKKKQTTRNINNYHIANNVNYSSYGRKRVQVQL